LVRGNPEIDRRDHRERLTQFPLIATVFGNPGCPFFFIRVRFLRRAPKEIIESSSRILKALADRRSGPKLENRVTVRGSRRKNADAEFPRSTRQIRRM